MASALTAQQQVDLLMVPAGYRALLLPDGDPLYGLVASTLADPVKLFPVRKREMIDFMARVEALMVATAGEGREYEILGYLAWICKNIVSVEWRDEEHIANLLQLPFGVHACFELITSKTGGAGAGSPATRAEVLQTLRKWRAGLTKMGPRVAGNKRNERALLLLWHEMEIAGRAYESEANRKWQPDAAGFEAATSVAFSSFDVPSHATRVQEAREQKEKVREAQATNFAEGEQVRLAMDKTAEIGRKKKESVRRRKAEASLPEVPGGVATTASRSSSTPTTEPGIASVSQPGALPMGYVLLMGSDRDPLYAMVVEKGTVSTTMGVRDREAAAFLDTLAKVKTVLDTADFVVPSGGGGSSVQHMFQQRESMRQMVANLVRRAHDMRLSKRATLRGNDMELLPFAVSVILEHAPRVANMEFLFSQVETATGLAGVGAMNPKTNRLELFGNEIKVALATLLIQVVFARQIRWPSHVDNKEYADTGKADDEAAEPSRAQKKAASKRRKKLAKKHAEGQ